MTMSQLYKNFITLFIVLLLSSIVYGHSINYELEKATAGNVIWYYFKLGIEHIVPNGIDHILFVIALCLLNNKLKTICWQATAFTVAHSITLALSMKNMIVLPGAIIEPIIALSIVFVAIENILLNE